MLATVGIAIAFPVVLIGLLPIHSTDRNRLRYMMGAIRISQLMEATEKFRMDCGRYPTTEEGLDVLVSGNGPKCSHAPYLDQVPLDPWQRHYIYSSTGGIPEIRSLGADGKPGGEFFNADLSSRSLTYSYPQTPQEKWRHRELVAAWFTSIVALIVCPYVLVRSRRMH